jgi:hypothetical protein
MAFVPVSYSDGIPVLASNGTQRVACPHLASWLAAYDALQVARGRGHVTYYQTMGGADASAGTHLCGSAWDMAYHGSAPIMDAREMGAAVWPRLHSLGWPASQGEHVHGLIRCGDNACNGYQYSAYLGGYNGLGLNGWGAGDPLPKPATIRTWQDGIAWAKAEIARLTTPAPAPQEDDDMPVFMRTTDGTIWALRPAAAPRGLSPQEWALMVRLGAKIRTNPDGSFDNFNRAEVDIVNSVVQPNPVDVGAISAAITAALPHADAITPADVDAIAQAIVATLSAKLAA